MSAPSSVGGIEAKLPGLGINLVKLPQPKPSSMSDAQVSSQTANSSIDPSYIDALRGWSVMVSVSLC